MKKCSTFLISFLLLFFVHQIAYAHFPATDKTITVILHVDPNDDPIPDQPATLYFDFGDTTNRFKLENCSCIVTVKEQGKEVYQHQLVPTKNTAQSIWGTSMPYTFPKRDVYQILLTGKPIHPNAFQSYTLSWFFRVDQFPVISNPQLVLTPIQTQPAILSQRIMFIVCGLLIVLLLFGAMYMNKSIVTRRVDKKKKMK